MKKLANVVKWKWFPLIAAIALLVLAAGVVLVMALFGWRFTYAPELENSWGAVSAVAAWAGVIMSFLAVMVAVWIPKRIADRQDKIALFEKRYDCYTVIQNLLVCAEQMEDVQTNKGVQMAFRARLGEPEKIYDNLSATTFALQLKQKQVIVVSGEFLFSHYNTNLLQEIIDVGIELVLKTAESHTGFEEKLLSDQAMQLKTRYCKLCKRYDSETIGLMEKELQLNTNK